MKVKMLIIKNVLIKKEYYTFLIFFGYHIFALISTTQLIADNKKKIKQTLNAV